MDVHVWRSKQNQKQMLRTAMQPVVIYVIVTVPYVWDSGCAIMYWEEWWGESNPDLVVDLLCLSDFGLVVCPVRLCTLVTQKIEDTFNLWVLWNSALWCLNHNQMETENKTVQNTRAYPHQKLNHIMFKLFFTLNSTNSHEYTTMFIKAMCTKKNFHW